MTPRGKALMFYLKYPAEMSHLYEKPKYDGEEPDLTDLEDTERVREMARAVGDAAYLEAAEFLELCGEKIEEHFTSLGSVAPYERAKKRYILRWWEWTVNVRLTAASEASFMCGVGLYDMERIIVPWLWREGGRRWEEMVMERLGARAHSLAGGGVVREPGTVALARIPIFAENQQDGDVDRDALVAQVVAAFTAIRADDVEALARGVGDEGGSPEADESGGEVRT
jgi:hypothetical protein